MQVFHRWTTRDPHVWRPKGRSCAATAERQASVLVFHLSSQSPGKRSKTSRLPQRPRNVDHQRKTCIQERFHDQKKPFALYAAALRRNSARFPATSNPFVSCNHTQGAFAIQDTALLEKQQVALVEAEILDVFLEERKQEVLGDEGGALLQVELRHMLGEARETLSPSSSNARIARRYSNFSASSTMKGTNPLRGHSRNMMMRPILPLPSRSARMRSQNT